MKTFLRLLKLAGTMDDNKQDVGLLSKQINSFIKKHAGPWKANLDYTEDSPYFGSMSEFMEKFPNGVSDWLKWRREQKKAEYIPTPDELEYANEPVTDEERDNAKELFEKALELGIFTKEEMELIVKEMVEKMKNEQTQNSDENN